THAHAGRSHADGLRTRSRRDRLRAVAREKNPRPKPGDHSPTADIDQRVDGSGDGAGRGVAGWFGGAADFGPAPPGGGTVRGPGVVGGAFLSAVTRSLPLPNAKISRRTTTAIPAIQPQVAFDQGCAAGPAGERSGSR